jgi:hypothetical protein
MNREYGSDCRVHEEEGAEDRESFHGRHAELLLCVMYFARRWWFNAIYRWLFWCSLLTTFELRA